MSQAQLHKNKRVQATLALLLLSVVIVGFAVITSPSEANMNASSPSKSPAATKPVASTVAPSSSSSSTKSTSGYKNGSYSATGNYFSPGGQESLKVTLTLNNDIVTDAKVVSGANDPTASSYQSFFISGYKSKVIGKKINSIKLTNVSGSSLTSQGFEDALKQIEKQAAA